MLTSETKELLVSTKKKKKKNCDEDKDTENVTKLESVEVVLVHCNLVKNNYQHTSKMLFTFVQNKQLRQLINISTYSFVWFTSKVSKALEIEDHVNLRLIIG